MKHRTMSGWVIRILLMVLTGLFLGGCATTGEKPKSPLVATDKGTAIYEDKYEFKAPMGWKLLRELSGGDFEFGFLKFEQGDFPSQTTFIYDPEPFGSSQDLETRAKQYCSRFLWNSGVQAKVKKLEPLQLWGHSAVIIYLDGENPNRNEKATSVVYLVTKGHRVISFACTQWRPMNGTFAPEPFEQFKAFVESFRFLKKPFYEEFEEKLKKAKS